MSTFAVNRFTATATPNSSGTTISEVPSPAQPVFNAYAGMEPPQCCYCAPLPVAGDPEFPVDTVLDGGYGNLAFMTRTENAFRILQRTREAPYVVPVEAGYGPYSFDRSSGPTFSV